MHSFTFIASDEADTDRLGAALAAVAPDRAVIGLEGTLGAGKTRLVQAFARAIGVPKDEVTSPTFVLINEYQGQRTINHFDAYRLRDLDEFEALGPEEYFDRREVTFVEWSDRVAAGMPADRLTIHIEVTGPTQRRFELSATDETWQARLDSLATKLAGNP